MDWKPISTAPESGRIIVYSPHYCHKSEMTYRIADAQFVKHMAEATHWAKLIPPETIDSSRVCDCGQLMDVMDVCDSCGYQVLHCTKKEKK